MFCLFKSNGGKAHGAGVRRGKTAGGRWGDGKWENWAGRNEPSNKSGQYHKNVFC